MSNSSYFFRAIGLEEGSTTSLRAISKKLEIPVKQLRYYDEYHIAPTGGDLNRILNYLGISKVEFMLRLGVLNSELTESIRRHAHEITNLVCVERDPVTPGKAVTKKDLLPTFQTELGELYQADCMELLPTLSSESIDLVFADPPFNLDKLYPSKIDDNLRIDKYLSWCEGWIDECVRVLKPGGALFLWNLPKWNSILANRLQTFLSFRHWIAVDIKFGLPIASRLYPSHYSLLYYVKGRTPKSFHPDRMPMLTCPKCHGDLRDYGGYKDKMNPAGINLTDIWNDIPPVRHAKYRRRKGANELSIKLLDRVLELASDEGDLIFDPFGGAGTTFMAAEIKGRRWIGCEIGPVDSIVERFFRQDEEEEIIAKYRANFNALFSPATTLARRKKGLWTCESVRKVEADQSQLFPDDEST